MDDYEAAEVVLLADVHGLVVFTGFAFVDDQRELRVTIVVKYTRLMHQAFVQVLSETFREFTILDEDALGLAEFLVRLLGQLALK